MPNESKTETSNRTLDIESYPLDERVAMEGSRNTIGHTSLLQQGFISENQRHSMSVSLHRDTKQAKHHADRETDTSSQETSAKLTDNITDEANTEKDMVTDCTAGDTWNTTQEDTILKEQIYSQDESDDDETSLKAEVTRVKGTVETSDSQKKSKKKYSGVHADERVSDSQPERKNSCHREDNKELEETTKEKTEILQDEDRSPEGSISPVLEAPLSDSTMFEGISQHTVRGTGVGEREFNSDDETLVKKRVNCGDEHVDEHTNHGTDDREEDDSNSEEVISVPNNCSQRGHYCSVIWNNYQYMVDHMNFVKKIAGRLFKLDILDLDNLEMILKNDTQNGPSSAVCHLLEIMYRDPDPEHHELFYKALEETNQQKLAKRLRGEESTEEADTTEEESVHREAIERSPELPNPDHFTQDKVAKQLRKNQSLVYCVIHFASTGIQSVLQSVNLNDLLEKLKDESILEVKELYELQDVLKDDTRGKMKALKQLILLLQGKSQEELVDFIDVLRQRDKTAHLASWLRVILSKCECLHHSEDLLQRSQNTQPGPRIPVEVTIESQGDTIPVQEMTRGINEESEGFLEEVLDVEGYDTTATEKCIQISLVVEDQWEVENLQTSVEHGLFTNRLRLWLRQHGYDITDKTQFKATLKTARKEAEEGKTLAIYLETVSLDKKSSSGKGAAKHSANDISEVPFSSPKSKLWQKELVKNSFYICENLKHPEQLNKCLAGEQDEACQNIIKYAGLNDEIKVLLLLKLVIYKSLRGYQIFLKFVKETGQYKILDILPPVDLHETHVPPSQSTDAKDYLPKITYKKAEDLSSLRNIKCHQMTQTETSEWPIQKLKLINKKTYNKNYQAVKETILIILQVTAIIIILGCLKEIDFSRYSNQLHHITRALLEPVISVTWIVCSPFHAMGKMVDAGIYTGAIARHSHEVPEETKIHRNIVSPKESSEWTLIEGLQENFLIDTPGYFVGILAALLYTQIPDYPQLLTILCVLLLQWFVLYLCRFINALF